MRARVLLGMVVVLLIAPAVANAKGPDAATIEGAGVATPISLTGQEIGPGDFSRLVEQSGFFPAAFPQTPDRMLAAAPTPALGPKLIVRWRVPSDTLAADTVSQDLYPYAAGGPLTYTAPGQLLLGTQHTHGGWFRASGDLGATLTRLGAPDQAALEAAATPPPSLSTPTAAQHRASDRSPWPAVALITALVGVALFTTRSGGGPSSARVAPA